MLLSGVLGLAAPTPLGTFANQQLFCTIRPAWQGGSGAAMKSHLQDRIAAAVFALCAAVVIIAIASIFIFVGANALQTFFGVKGIFPAVSPAAFFFGHIWNPDNGQVGALIPIVGSFVVTILAVLVSTPISVGLAVFITQVAPAWARQAMQPVLELFIGIPSVIYGLLALQILVPIVAKTYDAITGVRFGTTGFGVVPAALVLAVMILPTITTLSVDALGALPSGLREASLALGATRWQTIARTLVPASATGIFTGVILGTGRAIGETLAVSLVIGGSVNGWPIRFDQFYPYVHLLPTSAIPVILLFDFGEATPPSLNYSAIWTLAFVLLVISFLLVAASRYIASRSVFSVREQRAPRQRGQQAPSASVRSIIQ
jgi:phosphate transport system permease protein